MNKNPPQQIFPPNKKPQLNVARTLWKGESFRKNFMEYRRRYVRHSLCKPRFTLHLSGSLAPPRAEVWIMGKLSGPGFQGFLLRYKWTQTRSLEPALRAGNERMFRDFLRCPVCGPLQIERTVGFSFAGVRPRTYVLGPITPYLSLIVNSPMSFSTLRSESNNTSLPVSMSAQNTKLSQSISSVLS